MTPASVLLGAKALGTAVVPVASARARPIALLVDLEPSLATLIAEWLDDIGDLAERVFILKPSATRTVKNLEARGIVSRSRPMSDQRRALIALTPRGRALFDELAPHSELEYARITQRIGRRDMDGLYVLLGRVTDALNRD